MNIPCSPNGRCTCGTPRFRYPTCPFCRTENQVCWAAMTYQCRQCGVVSRADE